MPRLTHAWGGGLVLLGCGIVRASGADQACQPPPLPQVSAAEVNFFNPQQEIDLGDAVAEQIAGNLRTTADDTVIGYLTRLGESLLQSTPDAHLKLRFFLADLPTPDAFSLPGGRIYISRKLAAFVRSEDEMAGVVAHEVGHLITHQGAIDFSRLMEELLGVTSVGDRRDIFEKYHRVIESRRPRGETTRRLRAREQERQLAADQVALYLLVARGYSPESFVEIFDRIAQTEGKGGNWLSDLLGRTKPEAQRLRELVKTVGALPPQCIKRAARHREEFRTWQSITVEFSRWDRQEVLHDVLARVRLDPPLRADIRHLKFSPDGRYILAQDDGNIYVLSRDPFSMMFRLDAPEAEPARFTPDSKAVAFHNSHLRVEVWDVASARRVSAHEPVVARGCHHSALSPDAKTLACVDMNSSLLLLDVASGATLFEKKSFVKLPEIAQLIFSDVAYWKTILPVPMSFSPDGRYFAAGSFDHAIAFDLAAHDPISLKGSLPQWLSGGFTFTASDQLVARDNSEGVLVQFPSGKVLRRFPLGMHSLSAPTRGNYLLLRPAQEYAVVALDLETQRVVIADKKPALDIYDQNFVRELADGELGMYDTKSRNLLARAALPRGLFGAIRAVAFSDDLKWLALSENSRGAVWYLRSGERLYHLRGFSGAYFSEEALYVDFPKFEKTERSMTKVMLSRQEFYTISKIDSEVAKQHGKFLVIIQPRSKGGWDRFVRNVVLEVRDVRSGTPLWSRQFPKQAPGVAVEPAENKMVLWWSGNSGAAAEEIEGYPEVQKKLNGRKPDKGVYLIEVVDAQDGKGLGALLLDTGHGSFAIRDIFPAGKWVVVQDNASRVLLYSLETGEQQARLFGWRPELSAASGLLAIESERDQLGVYDLGPVEQRGQFVFSSPIVAKRFSADGKRLYVVTADQTAYVLDVSRLVN